MAICLALFPPSNKFHSYLEGYINKNLEDSDWKDVSCFYCLICIFGARHLRYLSRNAVLSREINGLLHFQWVNLIGRFKKYHTFCFPQKILRKNGLQFLLRLTIVQEKLKKCLCKIWRENKEYYGLLSKMSEKRAKAA